MKLVFPILKRFEFSSWEQKLQTVSCPMVREFWEENRPMDFKISKLHVLRGFLARCVLRRILMLAAAVAMLPVLKLVSEVDIPAILTANAGNCSSNLDFFQGRFLKYLPLYAIPLVNMPSPCNEKENFTSDMFRELLAMNLLSSHVKALCVGEGSAADVSALRELKISDVLMVDRYPFPFLVRKRFIYDLSFRENSFDFVFSRVLDQVSTPALFVLEIERVLKPGGVGAMLVGVACSSPGSLIKTATPISLFLKRSDVFHVRGFSSFTLVVFKKRCDDFGSFAHYRLPDECPSIMNNKPLIEKLEPPEEETMGTREKILYLPNFMNISDRKRLIYIDVEAGGFANSSIANWFLPFYPMQSRPFEIYAVEPNASLLSSYVGKTGVTFIYYPGLSGKSVSADLDPVQGMTSLPNDVLDGFDFLGWLQGTVTEGDFVVLKMSAGGFGLKLLHELFKSGAICLIDELFLHCKNGTNDQDMKVGDCLQLIKALRCSGVFVHRW